MKPITLYFAGAWVGKASLEEIKIGIRNKLCSFVYPDQFNSWLEVSEGHKGKILIDSGAFSAWNKGDVIDFDAYIEYAKDCIARAEAAGKTIRIVNLDVIPGKKGETAGLTSSIKKEDRAIIDKAAEEGYNNLCYFLEKGVTPIHVFHQGEDFKWLEKMIEKTDYIGVSPANDLSTKQKRLWIDRVFDHLTKMGSDVKTHGFAVFAPKIILTYPWTSCDAATWRLLAAYGKALYPVGGFSTPDYSQNPICLDISEKLAAGQGVNFVKDTTKALEEDGHDYQDLRTSWAARAKMNIRYFIEFEKWVNEQKTKTSYKVTNRFFG